MLLRSLWRRSATRRPARVRAFVLGLLWLASCWIVAPALAAPTVITPATVSGLQVGVPYSVTFEAAGGTGPYSYSLTSGSIPAGMSLSSTGALSGTPTAAGPFNFTLTVTDATAGTLSQSYSATVQSPAIAVTVNAPTGVGSQPYAGSISAAGGTAPYTVSVLSGSLPPGISLNSNGNLSGTPTTAGTFNATIRVRDNSTGTGAPFSVTMPLAITITTPTLTIAPASIAQKNVGENFSTALIGGGGAIPYSYSLASGSLPPGVSLNSSGSISGPAVVAGSYNFTVTITDSNGFTGQHSYTIDVVTPTVTLTSDVHDGVAYENYTATFQASGGNAPYTYSLESGGMPPGMGLGSGGSFSGQPTTPGVYHFTVKASDASVNVPAFTATLPVTMTITAPGITVSPVTLNPMRKATPFQQTFTATGGVAPYTFSLASGGMPPGLGLNSTGVLNGTPANSGNFTFTVRATDAHGFTGDRTYAIYVMGDPPVANDDTATLPANSSQPVAVTGNDTGQITSIAIAQAPAHGTATVNGLNVVYTPTSNYTGSDTLKYTVTGPDGTSAPATLSITVAVLPPPVATAKQVSVLAGQSVIVHGAEGATGGPFTSLAITTPPTAGTATVSGTDITFTAPADASGTDGLDYTLSNAFGTSAAAHVTITVNPAPMTVAKSAQVAAGQSVSVDVTEGAHGGPFTAAQLVAVTPTNAGNATFRATATGYALDFTASATYAGAASVSYTLSNAYASSSPGTVSITVTARSDPSKDAEVLGILDAQADAARRLALGQISNFQRRLEGLHGGVAAGFSNGITLGSASNRDPMRGLRDGDPWARRMLVEDNEPGRASGGGSSLPGGIGVWTGGAVNFGTSQIGAAGNGIDFTTSGLSVGVDKQVTDALALGGGVGYGHDASDVGRHNSRSTVDSYNVGFYGSYRPAPAWYIDGLVGYQWLSYDARRYVTDTGGNVNGSRDGKQWFASFAVGYDHHYDTGVVAPYARFDIAQATLDAYTEHGDATHALAYDRQHVKTTTGTLGIRADWAVKRDYGTWVPRLRAEFGHDFQGSGAATMRYADFLTGPLYRATLSQQSRNHTLVGLGIGLQASGGWMLRAEYQNLLDNTSRDNQSILFGVEKQFDPH